MVLLLTAAVRPSLPCLAAARPTVGVTEVSSGASDTLPPLPATTTSATIPQGSLDAGEAYSVGVTTRGPRFASKTVTVPVPVERVPVSAQSRPVCLHGLPTCTLSYRLHARIL